METKEVTEQPWYGWVFTQTDTWRACEKEHIRDLFNDYYSENVLKAKDVETIQALLIKHEGMTAKEINELYK